MDYFDHIPLLKPWIDDDELREVENVLKSGWIAQGPKAKELEDQVAKFVGAPFVVATNSATSALHLAFQVSGLQRGQKVIVPAHTCMATVNAIVVAGGVPVFADIDPRTFNTDPAAAEAALDDDVWGIMVVHQVGLPADLDGFRELARRRGLLVVEDAATAFGAKYRGQYLGSYGNPTVFSLHPRKMITTGEGGMLTLFREDCDERARRLRSAGASISDFRRHQAKGTLQQVYPEPGYNYRLTDIQAAVGIAQMRKAERMLEMRAAQAAFYNERLSGMDEVLAPYVPPYATPCWSSYCITVPRANDAIITDMLGHMADRGISCRRGIQSLCNEPYFQESHKQVCLPHTDAVSRTTMFLPIFPGLRRDQQERVIAELKVGAAKVRLPIQRVTEPATIELSVILPAYNEGHAVANAVDRYCCALPRCCGTFEVLVIDDGSHDNTREVAEEAASRHSQVRVLVNEKNLGQAGSALRGFAEAQGQVIMHNGIDLPFDPENTAEVLDRMRRGADVVVVERIDRQAYGLFRKFVSRCNILVLRLLFRSPFTDHNFVQAYRRCVLDAITVESRGVATVTPELILKALAAGFVVETVQAPYHGRASGASTVTVKRILHTVGELLRLWFILRRQRRLAANTRSPS